MIILELLAAAAVGQETPLIAIGIAQETTVSCQFGKPKTDPSGSTDVLGIFLPAGLSNEGLTKAEVIDPAGLLSSGTLDRVISQPSKGSIHLTTAGLYRMLLTIMPKEPSFRSNALLGPLNYFSSVKEGADRERNGICRITDGVGARLVFDRLKMKSEERGQ